MGRTTAKTRSVVTFHQDPPGDDESLLPIQQEVDLEDYEVLIETYKFLTRNRRRKEQQQQQQQQQQPPLRLDPNKNPNNSLFHDSLLLSSFSSFGHCDSRLSGERSNRNDDDIQHDSPSTTTIVCDKHKWAILTLTEVDATTKRVVRIGPEFFPPNTRVLPACLGHRLKCLKSLCLDHCNELTRLPAEFRLPNLEELGVDVTSFEQPFPKSLGNLKKLRTLVVKGKCSSPDHWSKCGEGDESGMLLFPQSLANLTNLGHLEIHARNLLQIPAEVFESWGSSLETLVTTQDLSSPNKTNNKPSPKEDSDGFFRVPRSRSCSTDDSSEDDFLHLHDSSDDDDDSVEESGFSILKHRNLFREALESQLEVRAFRSIARFRKLRSLTLLFDDSKRRTGISSPRRRRTNGQKKTAANEDTYSVPLALLAGPLSMSLRELDIGTCIASETPPSSSTNKPRIPIEVSWIDILQEFPMLESLRLKDCLCSFSNKTASDDEKVLRMTKLRELVLDRCPDFAVDDKIVPPPTIEPSLSQDDDIEIVDANHYFGDEEDDNEGVDGPEKLVFPPRLGGEVCDGNNNDNDDGNGNGNGNDNGEDKVYFQPLKDERFSRILRLSGLLADTIQTPRDEEGEDAIKNGGERTKLSSLCTKFLNRCPVLEVVSIRECKIKGYCEDLLVCLPQNRLRELAIDVLGGVSKNDLRAIVEAYPSLVRLRGTCLKRLSKSERKTMHRSMVPRQEQQQSKNKNFLGGGPSLPMPWSILWDKKREEDSDKENTDDPNSKPIVSVAKPSSVVKENGLRRLWPVAALEETLVALDKTCHDSVDALEQKLFATSDKKRQKSLAAAVEKSLRSTTAQRSN